MGKADFYFSGQTHGFYATVRFFIKLYSPKIYREIKLKFYFKGDNLSMAKLERAIKLSEEKYCNVSAILSKSAKIVHEISIL